MNSNKRANYLVKNTVIFAIGSFGTKVISFFLVPLYTHLLTTSQYGIVDLITTVRNIVVPIVSLNIGEAVMRFMLDKNADKNNILNIGLTVMFFVPIVSLIIIPISKFIPDLSGYYIHIYLSVVTMAYVQILLCHLRGNEQLMAYSLGNIIHTLAIAIFNIIFLLVFRWEVKGYFYAYIAANIVAAVFAFIVGRAYDSISRYKFDGKLFGQMAKFSVVLIPTSFMWWIMNSSDRIMITAMVGASANGVYAISYKVPTLLTMITSVFTQAWTYSAIREEDSKDRDEYTNRVYSNLYAVVINIAAGMMLLIKPFLRFYVENSYYEAWRYTPYLILGFVFNTLATFMSTAYTVHKDSKGFLLSGTCGAALNVLLNFMLIPTIGVEGAALATCISYFGVFVFRVINTKKYINIKVINIKDVISYIILISMGVTMFFDNVCGNIILTAEFAVITVINIKSLILSAHSLMLKSREKHI